MMIRGGKKKGKGVRGKIREVYLEISHQPTTSRSRHDEMVRSAAKAVG